MGTGDGIIPSFSFLLPDRSEPAQCLVSLTGRTSRKPLALLCGKTAARGQIKADQIYRCAVREVRWSGVVWRGPVCGVVCQ